MVSSKVSALLAGLFVVSAVVVTAAARSASDPLEALFPWLAGRDGAPAVSARAPERLLSLPFHASRVLTAWSVERTDGAGPCLALRLTDAKTGEPPPGGPPAFANMGLDCALGADPSGPDTVSVALSWVPATGSPYVYAPGTPYRVVLTGRVPAAEVARLTLGSSAGEAELPLAGRFFVAVLPGTTASQAELPQRGLVVVARRADGSEVARRSLDAFLNDASPPGSATP